MFLSPANALAEALACAGAPAPAPQRRAGLSFAYRGCAHQRSARNRAVAL